jgi:acyl-CoA thioester hydrolase
LQPAVYHRPLKNELPMPFVHTHEFKVRHYECDVFEELHPANYLRYMQEAAFGASAAVGYPPARYAALNLQWLAYETDLVYEQPLIYGDTVRVKTWVQDFRRVRSLRQYEFYRGDVQIGQASTDWVLFDTVKQFPASVPPEIIAAYSQGEAVDVAPPRTPLPPARIPERGLLTIRRRVAWPEIDAARHVNNAQYLNYVEDCEAQAMHAHGWPVTRIRELGATLAHMRHQIEYKQAAVFGDEIEISTWIAAIDATSVLRHFIIKRLHDDKLLARVRGLRRWRAGTSGQVTIPVDYAAAFAANTVTG